MSPNKNTVLERRAEDLYSQSRYNTNLSRTNSGLSQGSGSTIYCPTQLYEFQGLNNGRQNSLNPFADAIKPENLISIKEIIEKFEAKKGNYLNFNVLTSNKIIKNENENKKIILKRLQKSVDNNIIELITEIFYLRNTNKPNLDSVNIFKYFFETLKDRKNGSFNDFKNKINDNGIEIPNQLEIKLEKLFNKISPKKYCFRSKGDCNKILDTVSSKIYSYQEFIHNDSFLSNGFQTFDRNFLKGKIKFFLNQNLKILDIIQSNKKPEDINKNFDIFYQSINENLLKVISQYEKVIIQMQSSSNLKSSKKAYKDVKNLAKIDPFYHSGQSKLSEDTNGALSFFREKRGNAFKSIFKIKSNKSETIDENIITGMQNKLNFLEKLSEKMQSIKNNKERNLGFIPSLSSLNDELFQNDLEFQNAVQSITSLKVSKETQNHFQRNEYNIFNTYSALTGTIESLKGYNSILDTIQISDPQYLQIYTLATKELQEAKLNEINLEKEKNEFFKQQTNLIKKEQLNNSKFLTYDILCNIMSTI